MESDRQLVQRVVRRDAQGFDLLMQRHSRQVADRLLRIVRDESAAADLHQETWLRVWQSCTQWDGRGSFVGWVVRIATNLALNHLRTVRRSRQCPLEPHAGGEDADTDLAPGWMVDAAALGPDEIVAQQEQHALLRGLVDALPEQTREMLRLIHQEQMDLARTAEALELPLGTVKSRLHYTYKRLGRQWLARQDWEDRA